MRVANQQGFSMIEVLVTLLLITIGVLGLVAMQGRAIAYTQDSVQRNTAAMLTDDLFEMMRANRDEILNINGKPKDESGYYKAKGAAFADLPDTCSPTPIDPGQQLACWAESVEQALPGASELLVSDFYIRPAGTAIEIQLAWMVKAGECMNETASDIEQSGESGEEGTGEAGTGSEEQGGSGESEGAGEPGSPEIPEEAEEPVDTTVSPCHYRLRSEL